MSLAIFDLDNTLIADDSDYLWGKFLVSLGVVNKSYYEQKNLQFYRDYQQGNLDIYQFLNFSLKPLADNSIEQLFSWREQFIQTIIKPILLPSAHKLIAQHKVRGDTLLVITATNKFIAEPIVNLYGIDNLLATIPEFCNGRFTGKASGTPCFQAGKVKLLSNWLKTSQHNLTDSWFYSDSHNDLPLLKKVANPIAVDCDQKLAQYAQKAGWTSISLRK